jgi:hypothetical protein
MVFAGPGDSGLVIERTHYVRCLATFASEELAICTWRLPARPPFRWNVDNVIPVRQFVSGEK